MSNPEAVRPVAAEEIFRNFFLTHVFLLSRTLTLLMLRQFLALPTDGREAGSRKIHP